LYDSDAPFDDRLLSHNFTITPGSVAESSRFSDGLLEAERVLLQKLKVRRFISVF
jgi:hypothetical protein